MRKKLILGSFFSFALILLLSPATFAARPTTNTQSTPLGMDISWPQCGKKVPKDQAFGVVGVNGGLANTTNSCLATQLGWAKASTGGTKQDKIQLYVNTANPGGLNTPSWPQSNADSTGTISQNPYGDCDGSDSLACAWQYGWNRAVEDVRIRLSPAATQAAINPAASAYIWWLDVETENTWKTGGTTFDYQSNVADLEGMTAYFKSEGARVGLYSTAAQWAQVVDKHVGVESNLNGLPNWRPGGANLSTAKQACATAPLTIGGSIVLTQYISKNLDYDYSCAG